MCQRTSRPVNRLAAVPYAHANHALRLDRPGQGAISRDDGLARQLAYKRPGVLQPARPVIR